MFWEVIVGSAGSCRALGWEWFVWLQRAMLRFWHCTVFVAKLYVF